MDNFMDRLTKRFNAGELIQANGEADAREMRDCENRLRNMKK